MIKSFLISRLKHFKRQRLLNGQFSCKRQYAFIGAGNHSLNCLYPCIREMGIPLKYICTLHISNAQKMAHGFPGATGTDKITDIIHDPEIKGVFVSLPPHLHYPVLKQLFSASKHVFIEKPPCYSTVELQDLISLQEVNFCLTGLQKRFCSINHLLRKKTSETASYNYRYLTGSYPEGNPVYELFIHPIDNVIQLFGKAVILHLSKISSPEKLTVFVLLKHAQGTIGCVELSTNYSWNDPVDHLAINNADELLNASYPNLLTGVSRIKSLFGLPMEKVIQKPVVQKVYLNNNGFSPVLENNSLVLQGYYGEIKHFVHVVEKNETDEKNRLSGLLNVYEILDAIGQE